MRREGTWILDARLCWMVLAAFCCLALLPPNAGAALVESRLADGSSVEQRLEDLDTVRQLLEQKVVTQRLADYGLTPAEIEAKLPSLSDEQLHQLASLSKNAGEGGVLGAVIAVLVIVLLVIVILKITDKQIVVR